MQSIRLVGQFERKNGSSFVTMGYFEVFIRLGSGEMCHCSFVFFYIISSWKACVEEMACRRCRETKVVETENCGGKRKCNFNFVFWIVQFVMGMKLITEIFFSTWLFFRLQRFVENPPKIIK
jgi:hypothetical protein